MLRYGQCLRKGFQFTYLKAKEEMESLWKAQFSGRGKVYARITRQYGSTLWRVYYLGHGGRYRSFKDMQVLEALQRQGAISHIYPWRQLSEKYLNIFNYMSDGSTSNYKIWGEMFFQKGYCEIPERG